MRTKVKITLTTDHDRTIQVARVNLNRSDGYRAVGLGCAVTTPGEAPSPILGVQLALGRAFADAVVFYPDDRGLIADAFRTAGAALLHDARRRTPKGTVGMLKGVYRCAVWQ